MLMHVFVPEQSHVVCCPCVTVGVDIFLEPEFHYCDNQVMV